MNRDDATEDEQGEALAELLLQVHRGELTAEEAVKAFRTETGNQANGMGQSVSPQFKRGQYEERFVAEAANRGWKVLHAGWPDYLVYRPESDLAFMCEVKGPFEGIRRQQKLIHRLLKERFGVPVVISVSGEWMDPDMESALIRNHYTSAVAENRRLIAQLRATEELNSKTRAEIEAAARRILESNGRPKS